LMICRPSGAGIASAPACPCQT